MTPEGKMIGCRHSVCLLVVGFARCCVSFLVRNVFPNGTLLTTVRSVG